MAAGQKIGDAWVASSPSWSWYFFHSYNILMMLGILLSFLTVAYFWKRQKYSWDNLQVLIILIIPSAIIGARFYTLIFDGGWATWYKLAGMSIYGGVIGALIPGGIYLYIRRNTIDYRIVLGMMLPAVLLGQTIGRWGNFDNHEVYGKLVSGSSLNWLTFIKPHMFIYHSVENLDPTNPLVKAITDMSGNHYHAAYRAPIFFYESMLSFAGYLVLIWVFLDRGITMPGVTGGLYLAYYGVIRLILQTQRDSDPMNTSYFGHSHISVNLVVSSILIIIGIFIAVTWQWNLGLKIKIKGKEITLWPKKEYVVVKADKEVRRMWVGPKYTRTFTIYDLPENAKQSKRKINREATKGRKNV